MRNLGPRLPVWATLILLILATGLIFSPLRPSIAQDPPPDRPDPPPVRPDTPPDRPSPPPIPPLIEVIGSEEEQDTFICATVHGTVVNWGHQDEPGIPVNLNGASWQVQKITDDNGRYATECLGFGTALLNLQMPNSTHPMTNDVAVRLGYKDSFEVNLGLYSAEIAPQPPIVPRMVVDSTSAQPGDILVYTIMVTNEPTPTTANIVMKEVMLTDLLPRGLTPLSIDSFGKSYELWDNLITVNMDELLPGESGLLRITAQVNEDVLLGSTITNQASLMYQGHIATQTEEVVVSIPGENQVSDTDGVPAFLPITGAPRNP